MISIEEAMRLIENTQVAQRTSITDMGSSLGRVLSQDVYAPMSLPPFDNSAMDGFAVNGIFESYHVIGEVPAGSGRQITLSPGEAVRIFTGAMVPNGTTSVVMQEKALAKDGTLTIEGPIAEGLNIRTIGTELEKGELVFSKGHVVNAATVGLLASLGIPSVETYTSPRVAVLVTGSELVTAGQQLGPGQIYESNGISLAMALKEMGLAASGIFRVEDDLDMTTEKLASLLDKNDVVLVSGGISVGDYDFVKQAMDENGVEQIFYKVMQKPGKPLFFGRKGAKYVFALPGNPASALNCFYVYVRALLVKYHAQAHVPFRARLGEALEVKGTRPVFYRSCLENGKVQVLGKQSSSMLHSFAQGNALALLPPGANAAGQEVLVWLYG